MFNNMGVHKALLLAGCASTVAVAAPAMAQEAGAEEAAAPIVVTGSRIQRRDFEANSPIVTVDSALLEQSSTAAIEQNLNRLPQFSPAKVPTAGGDIQPTATNTPGSATISLRGIGANRNLVLVDGRRATPSNASGVVDVSTIPSAAIERVEIISGGASATYGADAVAGVTNFILKKNFRGLELDAQAGITEKGDGFEYQISGIMGTNFDDGRGNVSFAMSMNTREANYRKDRQWFQDLWANPDTTASGFFVRNPGIEFTFGNPIQNSNAIYNELFPNRGNLPITNQGVTFFANPDGSLFTTDFVNRGGATGFNSPNDDNHYKLTSAGTIGPNFTDAMLILPLTRYNALARGNYEINDWIGVFGQATFSRVQTNTQQEAGPLTGGWSTLVPWGSGVYTGGALNGYSPNVSSVLLNGINGYVDPTPGILTDNPTNPAFAAAYGNQFACATAAVGGCTNSAMFGSLIPADLQTLLNARENPNAPFTLRGLLPVPRAGETTVTTYNLLGGFEGKIPGTDWTWEAFVNHGESDTFSNQTGIFSLQRLRTLLTSPNFGEGFNFVGNPSGGGFGASTGTCTSGLNPFNNFEGVSQNCWEAVTGSLRNRSTVRQTIVETNLQGGLLELPAGTLRAAVGASYRELDFNFINDTLTTQGQSFLDQALGIYPSGNAQGFIDTQEVYGELLIPVLSDIPGIKQLDLEVGGRISNFSTTGTSYTYKILGDWQVTDWLRFRGGYNRAERAPNIGELFLASQQTFGGNNRGDVCSTQNPGSFSANPNANPTGWQNVLTTCGLLMEQSGDLTADSQFYGNDWRDIIAGGAANLGTTVTQPQSNTVGGFSFPTLVGNANLTPEKADTWTAGVVITSPFSSALLSRLRLTVDYYNISVKDAIAAQTVGSALQQCFDPALNPLATDPVANADTVFCRNVARNQTGALGNVLLTYVNNGRFRVSGIDAALDWGFDVGPGTLSINSMLNYQLEFKSADLPTNPLVDYAGTFGTTENGLNQGAYRYRLFSTLGYRVGAVGASLQWQHLPSVKDASSALLPTSTLTGAKAYDVFHLNVTYQAAENVGLRFGVDNLFNRAPPLSGVNTANTSPATTGQLPGGTYNDTFYDINGRRFYMGANFKF